MDRNAIAQIKNEIGYTEEIPDCCRRCRHYEGDSENGVCDLTAGACDPSTAVTIPVSANGRCNNFRKPPVKRNRKHRNPEAEASSTPPTIQTHPLPGEGTSRASMP